MKASEIVEMVKDWFNDNLAVEEIDEDDYWVEIAGGLKEFYRELKRRGADPVVDDCCMHIGVDETSDDRDIVEKTLAKCAAAEMKFV